MRFICSTVKELTKSAPQAHTLPGIVNNLKKRHHMYLRLATLAGLTADTLQNIQPTSVKVTF